jgi:hypothetical protein
MVPTERQGPHSPARILVVDRVTAPRTDLQQGPQLRVGGQSMNRKRLDLLPCAVVGLDAIHLQAGPRPDDRQRLVCGNVLTAEQLCRTAHHPPVLHGVTLQQRYSPPVL